MIKKEEIEKRLQDVRYTRERHLAEAQAAGGYIQALEWILEQMSGKEGKAKPAKENKNG
ncbi:MAG: hypothetical protein ACYS8Z_25835 [Planctomycetota bacterium]|jgi:hypothetical protein